MAKQKVERRLAAIFAADMVGYSRLMEADEEGTIARQKVHRKKLIDPKIAGHKGRIVKTTGDGLLAEFASVVDAVECAVEIQRAVAEHETDVPAARRIAYRMGINLGDIVIEGDDVLGDGVNVAARLEALAKPGEVLISGMAFDQLKKKLDYGYRFEGARKVKNIAQPVRMYTVLPDSEAGEVSGQRRWSPLAVRWAGGGLALIVILAGAIWWRPWAPSVAPASLARMAFPLPKKPSIAVLPFDNLSGDPKQDYFSDGITEEIISTLSKLTNMFVIARNSTFTYKGKPVKVQRVAEELGVRFVLEGSVRRSGDRVRITAQLIDATTGHHLWSERYDRELKEIFALQDEITRKIVTALEVKLTEGEWTRAYYAGTKNVKAWELVRLGIRFHRRFTKDGIARARELYKRAIALDPQYATAWSQLGVTHNLDGRFRYSASAKASFKRAVELQRKALSLDDRLAGAHVILGAIFLFQRRHDAATAAGEKSVLLDPNNAPANAVFGFTLAFAGRAEEAIARIKTAMRLSPYYPDYFMWMLGLAYTEAGRNEDAAQILKESLKRKPKHFLPYVRLAASLSALGHDAEARAAAAEVLRKNPKFTVTYWGRVSPYKDPAAWTRHKKALLKAGLPK